MRASREYFANGCITKSTRTPQSVCANVGACDCRLFFLAALPFVLRTGPWLDLRELCRFFWNPASLPASLEEYVEVHRVYRTYRFLTFSSSVSCAEVAGSEFWRYTYSWRSQVESARDGRHSVYTYKSSAQACTGRTAIDWEWSVAFGDRPHGGQRSACCFFVVQDKPSWTRRRLSPRRGRRGAGVVDRRTDLLRQSHQHRPKDGDVSGGCLRIWLIRLFPSPTFFQVRREKKGKQSLLARRYGKLTRNGCQKQNHNVYTQHASCVQLKLISQTMVAIDLSRVLYRCFVTYAFANQVPVTPFVLWFRTSSTRKMKVDLLSQILLNKEGQSSNSLLSQLRQR